MIGMGGIIDDLLGAENEPAGKTALRGDRFSVERFIDLKNLIPWMNKTRNMPIDAIDSVIVNDTYGAALWLFRQAAVAGNINATKSMQIWLDWAKPVLRQQSDKEKNTAKNVSPGSAAFMPREPAKEES